MIARPLVFLATLSAFGVIAFGMYLRFDVPDMPYISPDSWGYVGPALKELAGEPFTMMNGRSYPYPLFILAVWGTFQSVVAATVTQHILGGVGLFFFWFAFLQIVAPLKSRPALLTLSLGVGLIGLWMLATSTTVILYEQYLGPETLFIVLSSLLLFLHTRYVRAVLTKDIYASAGGELAALLFLNAYLFLLRPLYFFAVLVCSIPPVLMYLRESGLRLRFFRPIVLSGVLFAIVGLFADKMYRGANPKGVYFGPMVLFSFNAPIIYPTLKSDLSARGDDQETTCLRTAVANGEKAIQWSKEHPSAAVFNGFGNTVYYGDAMIYGTPEVPTEPAHKVFLRCFNNDPERLKEFYMSYAIKGLRADPEFLWAKIKNELSLFYGPNSSQVTNAPLEDPPQIDERRRMIAQMPKELLEKSEVGKQLLAFSQEKYYTNRPIATQIPSLLHHVNNYYRIAIAILLVGAIVDLLLGLSIRMFGSAGLTFPYLAFVIPLYNFGTNFGIALSHSLWIGRYIDTQFPFTIFTFTYAACYGLILLWGLIRLLLSPFIKRKPTSAFNGR